MLMQNFIKQLGFDNLPPEKQTEVLLKIGRIIQQNLILRIVNELNEEDKEEFDQLLATKMNDQKAILDFLRSKLPNLDVIVNEEIIKFKKESVDLINLLRG
jgi:diaminopimelate decarboxylase